jgi:hypothetical protein
MRRTPLQREKREQAGIVQLLRTFGWSVYVLGTRRPGFARCGCGRSVAQYQGTCQTPGIPDIYALPPGAGGESPDAHETGVWIECKAEGGRLRPEQDVFRGHCQRLGIDHVVGTLDDVIAWLIDYGYMSPHQVPHYRVRTTR